MAIILGIIGIIIGVGILVNPFFGLILVVALIPLSLFQAVSGTLFGIFSMATPIKIIGGLTFVSAFVRHLIDKTKWDIFKKSQVLFFIMFLMSILVSGFMKPGFATRESFTIFISFALLGFTMISLINSEKRIRMTIWVALVAVIVISIMAIASYFESISGGLRIRANVTNHGPNEFAIGLLPFVSIAFYSILFEKNRLIKIFALIAMCIIIFALMLTFSRGGFIGLIAMIVVGMITAKKKILSILFTTLIIAILFNVMPSHMKERVVETQTVLTNMDGVSNVDNTKRRYLLGKAAWEMFCDNSLIGVGIGNYYFECNKYQPVFAGRAHNMYLELLAELGIIGTLFFIGILWCTFNMLNHVLERANLKMYGYAKGLYIGLTGFLVAAVFLHAEQEKVLWFTIFMTTALDRVTTGATGVK